MTREGYALPKTLLALNKPLYSGNVPMVERFIFVGTWRCHTTLHVKQEVHDIAVLNQVVLAFGADKACFFGGVPATMLQEVGVAKRLGADEAPFKVGVDHAGALRSLVACMECPGAAFLFTCGKEGAQPENLVTLAHHGV